MAQVLDWEGPYKLPPKKSNSTFKITYRIVPNCTRKQDAVKSNLGGGSPLSSLLLFCSFSFLFPRAVDMHATSGEPGVI